MKLLVTVIAIMFLLWLCWRLSFVNSDGQYIYTPVKTDTSGVHAAGNRKNPIDAAVVVKKEARVNRIFHEMDQEVRRLKR